MSEMKLGRNILCLRRERGITQDELAEYLGVSKSAVSKWETGNSYPDILLLPQLASLFNISVDQLIGYEPQLTKEAIRKIYQELAEALTGENKAEALEKSREYVKKYYSCFPFLLQVAVLYLNNCDLQADAVLQEETLELCRRVAEESRDAALIHDAVYVEAYVYLMTGRAAEALNVLGEDILPMAQDAELIAASYQLLGNPDRAKEIFLITAYQHLVFLIQDLINYMALCPGQKEVEDITLERLFAVAGAFQLDGLHATTSLSLSLIAATVYAGRKEKDRTLAALDRFVAVCQRDDILELHGDDYFYSLEKWFQDFSLGARAPREPKLVKASIVAALEQNPVFDFIRDDFRFRSCVEKLKQI